MTKQPNKRKPRTVITAPDIYERADDPPDIIALCLSCPYPECKATQHACQRIRAFKQVQKEQRNK